MLAVSLAKALAGCIPSPKVSAWNKASVAAFLFDHLHGG
jgi:hypothetical protein